MAEWFRKNWPHSVALEVKVDGRKTSKHQERALTQVIQDRFVFKLPDSGRRNPFDYVILKRADAVVCDVTGRKVTCMVNECHKLSFTI